MSTTTPRITTPVDEAPHSDPTRDQELAPPPRPPSPPLPRSVNYHLWKPCNMRCTFCFATFDDMTHAVLPRGHLPREASLALVALLASRFEKITFAGGEPTLCPWLLDLMDEAKRRGATTMLVTNGSRLTPDYLHRLQGRLDWLTLSIDSASTETHRLLKRAVSGRPIEARQYVAMAVAARALGMRLKVNTVVTTLNAGEDMAVMLSELRPERWKILQALPVEGQNSGRIEPLLCSPAAFAAFVERHRAPLAAQGIVVVPEDHEAITGSYAMVDPAGRFFDDITGTHRYSAPILDTGLDAAWSQVGFLPDRFAARGGDYEFRG
ncbi:viperin family antiviral radical SAM protein [Chondromyces apiculatus]|uniref:S-adenosylmethionine-dependent nucleotide dehydratase n=1 Tax=Chondromyces apiculatus DSM 436 TaxID=1192034 RepID=A0A017SVT9_9BACT|nr:viperin family antiviral radical SAM protein [Chondromyces apiculatus]EYF01049.1 radical S-adenosyl methionine [Chondromyces apiculatus DSM 436]